MKIVSVAQMRELERQTFDAGTSPAELQIQAGGAVAAEVRKRWPEGGLAVALVGTGNNGRDAWIAAQVLIEGGWEARLFLAPGHAISDDELGSFQALGGQAVWQHDRDAGAALDAALSGATVVIDGLLGIGAHGAPREPLAALIQRVNGFRAGHLDVGVVSVDVPSGLDADTGNSEGAVILADLTVVVGAMKQGLLTARAAAHTGELVAVDIGVLDGPVDAAELLTPADLRGLITRRLADSHKGTFGRLLVVAGSEQYVGAAFLVCAAAIRAGAGLVTLAAPPWLRDVVAAKLPEVTFIVLPEEGPSGDPEGCALAIQPHLPRFTALAIGPGLSTEFGVPVFVEQILRKAAPLALPTVADADALNVLATLPSWSAWLGDRVVLTPHLGELARLMGERVTASSAPWALAGRLAREWRVSLVIKGPFTAIGTPTRTWVHARPNPALATAGTGDVLTGIVGALLARGMEPAAAARCGVAVHAEAGAEVGKGLLGGGLAASDLLAEIPPALARLVEI